MSFDEVQLFPITVSDMVPTLHSTYQETQHEIETAWSEFADMCSALLLRNC